MFGHVCCQDEFYHTLPARVKRWVKRTGEEDAFAYRSELLVLLNTQMYVYVVLRLCEGGRGGNPMLCGGGGGGGPASPCPVSGRPWHSGDSPVARCHCILLLALSWR